MERLIESATRQPDTDRRAAMPESRTFFSLLETAERPDRQELILAVYLSVAVAMRWPKSFSMVA